MKKIALLLCLLLGTLLTRTQAQAFSSCLSLYRVESIQPIERFTQQLELVSSVLSRDRSYQAKLKNISTNEFRFAIFQLQGLAKLYQFAVSSERRAEAFENFRNEMKLFEDTLGQMNLRQTLLAQAQKAKASQKLIRYLQEEVKKAEEKLIETLKENDWLPNPQSKVKELREILEEAGFKKKLKDKRFLVKAMSEYADGVRKKLKDLDEAINNDHYDLEILEEGPHEFRRQLRWITLLLQASSGVYEYKDQAPRSKEMKAIYDQYRSSKYIALSPASANPVKLDIMPVIIISKLVTDMGLVKDAKETEIFLAEALLKSGAITRKSEATQAAHKIAVELHGFTEIEKETQKLYHWYREIKPLNALRDNLDKELENIK